MLYYTTLFLLAYMLFLCIGVVKFRKSFDIAHSLIFYYIIFSFVNEILLRLCIRLFHNNIPLYNLFSLFEFSILTAFYCRTLFVRQRKSFHISLVLLFLLIYFLELIYKGPFEMLNYSFLFSNSLLVVLAIASFRKIANNSEAFIITDNPLFWINSAILIFFSCTIFIFGLKRYTLKYTLLTSVTNYLLLLFIFVFYSLLTVGLWKTSKK
jgi:hypothetical protein